MRVALPLNPTMKRGWRAKSAFQAAASTRQHATRRSSAAARSAWLGARRPGGRFARHGHNRAPSSPMADAAEAVEAPAAAAEAPAAKEFVPPSLEVAQAEGA